MAVYGNRLAGVTSDGGFVVWELPEVITDDVPYVICHFQKITGLTKSTVEGFYFVLPPLLILTHSDLSSGIQGNLTLWP
jgi:hypothetical protein